MQSLQAVSLLWSVGLEHLPPIVVLRLESLGEDPCHAAQHVGGSDDDEQHDEEVEGEEVVLVYNNTALICLMLFDKVPPFVWLCFPMRVPVVWFCNY